MKILNSTATAVFAALLVSACSAGVDTMSVGNVMPSGDPFRAALQMEYVELATLENEEADIADAHYFVMRAENAITGDLMGPQPMEERSIPADAVEEMTFIRGRLMNYLDNGAMAETPAAAARAQAMFDCWLQEQEENYQPDDIEHCRAEFVKAMSMLRTTPMAAAPAPAAPEPTPAPAPAPVSMDLMVYFATGSAALDDTAKKIVEIAAIAIKKYNPKAVMVVGHTDTVGSDSSNDSLSARRAAAVSVALADHGVDTGLLTSDQLGEQQPAVNSGDGMNEPKNRRVQIGF